MPEQVQPPWVTVGLKDLGFHETGNNQGIEKFIAQAHCGKLGDPWCAIWTNAKLEQSRNRALAMLASTWARQKLRFSPSAAMKAMRCASNSSPRSSWSATSGRNPL